MEAAATAATAMAVGIAADTVVVRAAAVGANGREEEAGDIHPPYITSSKPNEQPEYVIFSLSFSALKFSFKICISYITTIQLLTLFRMFHMNSSAVNAKCVTGKESMTRHLNK